MKERATPLDVENWTEDDADEKRCDRSDVGTPRNPRERAEAVSRAKAIVIATTHFNDPKILAEVSEQVTGTMKGLAAAGLEECQLLQTRGW
jgi:pyridoxal 5'-phosphate synthase pdxS subunit